MKIAMTRTFASLIVAALMPFLPAAAAPGDVDATFGIGGVTGVAFGFGQDSAQGVARQPDGKLVVAGQSADDLSGQRQFTLVRYNANGTLDASFGVGGVRRVDLGGIEAHAYSVVLQADGRIVAAGWYYSVGTFKAVVVRLNANGSLDTAFNGTGFNVQPFAGIGDDRAFSVALQADGKIVAGGYSSTVSGTRLAALRLNANGTLDTTFGSGAGFVLHDAQPWSGSSFQIPQGPRMLAVQDLAGSPRVLMVANTDLPPYKGFIVRLAPDGSKDAAFGTGGVLSFDYFNDNSEFNALYVTPVAQQIVVAGSEYNPGPGANHGNITVARLNSDGSFDASFNGLAPGKSFFNLGGQHIKGLGAMVDAADGSVIVPGIINSGSGTPLITRFTSGGAPDPTFSGSGLTVLGGNGLAWDAAAIGAGKMFVSGEIQPAGGNFDVLAVQLLANGAVDPAFGNAGFGAGDISNYGSYFTAIAQQADGKLLAAGIVSSGMAYLTGVARFSANGVPDTGFGPNGLRTFDLGGGYNVISNVFPVAGNKIVVTGFSVNAIPAENYMAARINPDGSLDTSFGTGGIAQFAFFGQSDEARGAALAPSGKVVLVGAAGNGTPGNVLGIMRIDTNGALDTTFNGTGLFTDAALPSDVYQVHLAKVLADESILVGGGVYDQGTFLHFLAKILPAGGFDPSFGTGGVIRGTFIPGNDEGFNSLDVQPDGKILMAGISGTEGPTFGLVARFLPNGTPDPTFGTGGFATTPQANSSAILAAALQSDGKLVTVGIEQGAANDDDVALRRFNTNGSLDATFAAAGRRVVNLGSTNDRAQAALLQPDGKLVVAGNYYSGLSMLARFQMGSLTAGVPASINATGGGGQSTAVGAAFGNVLSVVVRDAGNNPVSGATVTFTVPAFAPTATLSAPTATTDVNGVASVTATAAGYFGTYNVTATVTGVATPITFALTNLASYGTLTLTQIAFGNKNINVTWHAPAVTLANIGNIPMSVTSITAAGTGFFVSHNCPASVAPGGTCTLDVTFTTSVEGPRTGTVVVSASGLFAPYQILLAGNGVDLGNPLGDADQDGIPNGLEAGLNLNPLAKDNDVFGQARLFAMQQYRDFLGREGDAAGIDYYIMLLNTGAAVRANIIESFFNSPEFQGVGAPVARLYFAFFNRIPDYPGLIFQINAFRSGTPLAAIANNFSLSPEFVATYGALDNSQYVTLLYQNVLARAPAPAEVEYHVNRLLMGVTRGEVMLGFSESPEYQAKTANGIYVTMMYVGLLRRAPEQSGYDFWVNYMNAGNSGLALILGFLNAPEYRNRFLP